MQIKSWQIVVASPLFQAILLLLNFIYNTIFLEQHIDSAFQISLNNEIVSIMNSLSYYILSATLVTLLYYKESMKIAANLLVLVALYGIFSGATLLNGFISIIAVMYYLMYESKTQKGTI